MKINISIIICTYNSPKLIQRCLNSILNQNIKEKIEILLIDGGSNKKTLNILKDYENKHKEIKLIKNPEKLPEGYGKGKWLGFKKSKGAIFGIIDQDNELIGEDCLAELVKPFEEKEIFGSACRLYLDARDSLTKRKKSGAVNTLKKIENFPGFRRQNWKEENLSRIYLT